MDSTTNPYAPGAGTRPPELAGRDDILDSCRVALARIIAGRSARGILLTGLRGVGKTVLLNLIEEQAISAGYVANLIEAPEGSGLAPLIIPSIRQALLKLSVKAKGRDLIDRSLRVLRSFQLSTNVAGTDVGLKFDPELGAADSGSLERDLPDLLESVGEAARDAGRGVAVLIDEIQYLGNQDLSALIVAAHRIAQKQLPVAIMGAGLPSLPGLSGDAKSYAERLFRYPTIGALLGPDARDALAEPAEKLGVHFTSEAIEEVVSQTQGYPYFIQEWGSAIWDLARGPEITRGDVVAATVEATRRLDESFFRVRLNRVTDAEQRYLRAMAEIGSGNYKSGDVARILGRSTNSFGPVRDGLIRKGMIYSPRHGVIDFTVPLFDQFMHRAMPNL